jgi:hypothetical protein
LQDLVRQPAGLPRTGMDHTPLAIPKTLGAGIMFTSAPASTLPRVIRTTCFR